MTRVGGLLHCYTAPSGHWVLHLIPKEGTNLPRCSLQHQRQSLSLGHPCGYLRYQDRSLTKLAPILSVGQLSISDLKFSNNHLNVDTISITELKTDIRVNPDKSIVSLVDTSALSAEPQDKIAATESNAGPTTSLASTEQFESVSEETQALTFALGKLMLADAAYLHINDQSVSPVFEQKIA